MAEHPRVGVSDEPLIVLTDGVAPPELIRAGISTLLFSVLSRRARRSAAQRLFCRQFPLPLDGDIQVFIEAPSAERMCVKDRRQSGLERSERGR